jgi:thiamine pyrophosphokinase
MFQWSTSFLEPLQLKIQNRALIILNQPFSAALFDRLWASCGWHCCADGGANRLYDLFEGHDIEDGSTARGL